MSPSVRYLPILAALALLGSVLVFTLSLAGCPSGGGACTYDDHPAVEGEARIVSGDPIGAAIFYEEAFAALRSTQAHPPCFMPEQMMAV